MINNSDYLLFSYWNRNSDNEVELNSVSLLSKTTYSVIKG